MYVYIHLSFSLCTKGDREWKFIWRKEYKIEKKDIEMREKKNAIKKDI